MPSHCSGSLNWQKQSKTWDLTIWWLAVSAQCRFAQSVKLRVQSRPQAQAHHFYVLNWGKHEQCFSRKYFKSFHQDFIYPALFSCSAMVYLHDLGQVTLWLGCRLQWTGYCVPRAMGAGIFLLPGSPSLACNDPWADRGDFKPTSGIWKHPAVCALNVSAVSLLLLWRGERPSSWLTEEEWKLEAFRAISSSNTTASNS